MSDDTSSLYLSARETDPELEADLARFQDIGRKGSEKGFLERMAETQAQGAEVEAAGNKMVGEFILNLPRNVTVAVMDAALNTFEFGKDVLGASENLKTKDREARTRDPNAFIGGDPEAGLGRTSQERREKHLAEPFDYGTSPLMDAARQLRGELAGESGTSDEITQSAAQFLIPFTGWMKAFGGIQKGAKLANIGRAAAAETATMVSAFEPHEARFADLLRLTDTNNGLVNAYIDYMAADADEGEWEGRFKNATDSLVATAAIGSVIKAGGIGLKMGKNLPAYLAENAGTSRVGPGAQEGKIVFHGTPHDFDEFRTERIGSGEGNQSFGYGLYFAESPKTANSYKLRLSARANAPGSAMSAAVNALELTKGDRANAVVILNKQVETSRATADRDLALKAIELVKSGAAAKTGKLMHVDVDDAVIGDMLDHDAPMSEQKAVLSKIPEKDRAQIESMLEEHDRSADLDEYTGNELRQLIKRAISEDYIAFNPADGGFDNLEKVTAEYLASHGVPGIKYLDQGSRKTGEGTRNLVLFDAKHAKIVGKE